MSAMNIETRPEALTQSYEESPQRFKTHDGQELFYRRWWPQRDGQPVSTVKGAILLFHRGHEHSGRMAHLVEELQAPDFAFYAWDARGHGQSPGERGDAPSFADVVRDVDTFVKHIHAQDQMEQEQIAVVAQSVGAVVIAAWVHDYAPKIRAQILASPAFSVKLYVPFAETGLKLLSQLRGNFFVKSYVKGQFLSHDPERVASYDKDPLVTRPISVRMLLGLNETARRVVSDAAAIGVPTQLLVSDSDWVVRKAPQHEFFVKLGSQKKERHVLPGFYHDTLGERDRELALKPMRRFLKEVFSEPLNRPNLLNADLHGPTRAEADELATPLESGSAKGLFWSLTKASLKLGGWLSKGIQLGHETGFDSGASLDYVYQNQARGWSLLGRLVDRNYLDAIGWRGIRERKRHIEELLRLGAQRLEEQGRALHILDVAAGHGRYVLDAVAASERPPESIQLRDFCPNNVEAGRQLIGERGLDSLASFEQGDAFSYKQLSQLKQQASLAIVSGLYELFPDNAPVRQSLAGLAEAVEPGGYLIYTGQPWHPQLEFIARALTSHRQGQAWVMRRRTQAELDQLVEAAGFEKVEQRIGPFGIFTVSLAKRREA